MLGSPARREEPHLQPELNVLTLRGAALGGGKILHPVQQARPGGLLLESVPVPSRVMLALEQLGFGRGDDHAALRLGPTENHLDGEDGEAGRESLQGTLGRRTASTPGILLQVSRPPFSLDAGVRSTLNPNPA